MTEKITHVVLDLETASIRNNAAVLSIGAVGFKFPAGSLGVSKEFYSHLNLQDCVDKGLHKSSQTLEWWDAQHKDIKEEAFRGVVDGGSSLTTLLDFCEWYTKLKNTSDSIRLWGNGAEFDPVVLRSCMEAFDVIVPWHYREVRCLRTILHLLPAELKRVQPPALKHHAMWDARHEALDLNTILIYLHDKGVKIDVL